MAANPRQITSVDLFFLFHTLKSKFNKLFEFLMYETDKLHFFVRVYCNRSQNTSQRVKTTVTPLDFVSSGIILSVLYTL